MASHIDTDLDDVCEVEKALVRYEAEENVLAAAQAHRRIGEHYADMENFERALAHHESYLRWALRSDSSIEQQRAYATIGRTHYLRAEHCGAKTLMGEKALKAAESAFNDSFRICKRLKGSVNVLEHKVMKVRLLINFGLVSDCRNSVAEFTERVEHATRIADSYKLYEELYRCQYNMAIFHQRQNNLSRALTCIDEAINCAVTMKDDVSEMEAVVIKGKICVLLGDYKSAKHSLLSFAKKKKAISVDDKSKVLGMLKIVMKLRELNLELKIMDLADYVRRMKQYETMADTAANNECYEVALAQYLNMEKCGIALALPEVEMIPVYLSIAHTCVDLSQHELAATYFSQALRSGIVDTVHECKILLSLANAEFLSGTGYKHLMETYSRALEAAEESQHTRLQAVTLRNMNAAQAKFGENNDEVVSGKKLKALCQKYNLDITNLEDDDNSSETSSDVEAGPSDKSNLKIDEISDSELSSDAEMPVTTATRKTSTIRRNEKGESALHRACIEGNLQKVRTLIEGGHEVNPRDYCGWLPLHEAANHGFLPIVEYLLTKGARIDDRGGAKCGGITPLHDAANCGHIEIMEALLQRGANALARDDQRNTPLMALCEYQRRAKLSQEELSRVESMERQLRGLMDIAPNISSQIGGNELDRAEEHVNGALICEEHAIGDNWLEQDCRMTTRKRKSSVLWNLAKKPAKSLSLLPQSDNVSSRMRRTSSATRQMKRKTMKTPEVRSSYMDLQQDSDTSSDNFETRRDVEDEFSCNSQRSAMSTNDDDDVLLQDSEQTELSAAEIVSDAHRAAEAHTAHVDTPHPVSNALRLKVSVGDKLILVPVYRSEEIRTVSWLAAETADRYHQLYGLRPALTLALVDGTILAPNDIVTALFANNEELVGCVSCWNTASLHERYVDACAAQATAVYSNVKQLLEEAETKCCLSLSNLVLDPQRFSPVATSLQHQDTLTELRLAGNLLGDDGFYSLIRVIPMLPNLLMLGVSGNGLTSVSLQRLAKLLQGSSSAESTSKALQGLTDLDLSYNSFCDISAHSLCSCIAKLPKLLFLKMASCGITNQFFENPQQYLSNVMKNSGIQHLDIGLNSIGASGAHRLLTSANLTRLQSLHCISIVTSAAHSYQLLRNLSDSCRVENCALTELCLDGCIYGTDSISELCKLITVSRTLSKISMSSNDDVTSFDMQRILKASTVDTSRLVVLMFNDCNLVGPLAAEFLAALSCKMSCACPLQEAAFTVDELEESDRRRLTAIWEGKWRISAVCQFSGESIRLALAKL